MVESIKFFLKSYPISNIHIQPKPSLWVSVYHRYGDFFLVHALNDDHAIQKSLDVVHHLPFFYETCFSYVLKYLEGTTFVSSAHKKLGGKYTSKNWLWRTKEAKSNRSAKSPYLLNQWCDLNGLLDLKSPKNCNLHYFTTVKIFS